MIGYIPPAQAEANYDRRLAESAMPLPSRLLLRVLTQNGAGFSGTGVRLKNPFVPV